MKRWILVAALSGWLHCPVLAMEGEAKTVVHRLAPGQTLAWVARLYGIPLPSVLLANPGLDPRRLEVGTAVHVPVPETGWPTEELQPGEELVQLATRQGYPLEVLQALNPDAAGSRKLSVPLRAPLPPATPATQPAAEPAVAPGGPAESVTGLEWQPVTLPDGRKGWAPRSALLVPAAVPLTPQQLVELAQRFQGIPYRWGGQSPNGVDCSGFVHEVFRLGGHQLPRLADDQFYKTAPIDAPQLGDLVFFSTYLPGPSHVGISLGGQEFLHASSSRGVIRASLDEPYFKSRYLGARRLPVWAQSSQAASGGAPAGVP